MSSFTYRGQSSGAFGVTINRVESHLIPLRRSTGTRIPGRNGTHRQSDGTYEEREIAVDCTIADCRRNGWRERIRQIAYWLSAPGKLEFENDPGLYYDAELGEAVDLDEHFPVETFTLLFRCHPFAYKATTTVPLHTGLNPIQYEGTAPAPCIIVLKNTGTETIHNIKITAVYRRS